MFAAGTPTLPSSNLKSTLIEEIALDGLIGIPLERLWNCVSYRTSLSLSENLKEILWKTTRSLNNVTFYQVTDSLPTIEITDRFSHVDETGNLCIPDFFFDGPYAYCPVTGQYGSCKNFDKRKEIHQETLEEMTYKEVLEKWGDKVVAVASFEVRARMLGPHVDIKEIKNLIPTQYCLLELIGKSRYNGQLTTLKSNLTETVKDPKVLYYNRKVLKDLDLIRARIIYINDPNHTRKKIRNVIVLFLKKFDRPKFMLRPTQGCLYDCITAIKNSPERRLSFEDARQIMKTDLSFKEFAKCASSRVYFKWNQPDVSNPAQSGNRRMLLEKYKTLYLYLNDDQTDDSSSDSEVEEDHSSFSEKPQRIGVSLVKQALDHIRQNADGITIMQLKKMLRIDFYTARRLYKFLKQHKFAFEDFKERGRQKVGRLVGRKHSNKFAEIAKEKIELMKNIKESILELEREREMNDAEENDDTGTRLREKLHKESTRDSSQFVISEKPTLESLKLMNALLKVINEKEIFRSLASLRAAAEAECGITTYGKYFFQRAVNSFAKSKQLKVLRLENSRRSIEIICSNKVTKKHPGIRKLVDELKLSYYRKPGRIKVKPESKVIKNVKYSTRIPQFTLLKRIHLVVFQLAYDEANQNQGFVDIIAILNNLTIEVAHSLVCLRNTHSLTIKDINEHKNSKVNDAPVHIKEKLFQTGHLNQTLRAKLKDLARLGLVQVCNAEESDANWLKPFTIVVYANKNVSLINTVGDWPSKTQIIKRRRLQLKHNTDVEDFWNLVQNISLRTNITFEGRKSEKHPPNAPTRRMDEVRTYDDGNQVIGDGFGPCGFHSTVFMDDKHGWVKYTVRIRKRSADDVLKRPIKKRRRKIAKPNTGIKMEHGAKNEDTFIKTWEPWEDKILILCRVAQKIMTNNRMGAASKIVCFVARDLMRKLGKCRTTQSCILRIFYLERIDNGKVIKAMVRKVKESPPLIATFEGQFSHLNRTLTSNLYSMCHLRVIEFLLTFMRLTSQPPAESKFKAIARNLEEFNELFYCDTSERSKECQSDNEQTLNNVNFQTIKETLLFVINARGDDEPSLPIFHILSQYEDATLRQALKVLQIHENKITKNLPVHQLWDKAKTVGYYKLSFFYLKKLENRLLVKLLVEIFNTFQGIKQGDEIEPSSSLALILSEWLSDDKIDITNAGLPTIEQSDSNDNEDSKFTFRKSLFNLKRDIEQVKEIVDEQEILQSVDYFPRKIIYGPAKETILCAKHLKIIKYLDKCKEFGSTIIDIAANLSFDTNETSKLVEELESNQFVGNFGYNNSRIVLHNYVKPWTFKFEGQNIIPMPCLSLNKEMHVDKLLALCTTIINIVIEYPGATCRKVSEVVEIITPMNVKIIAEYLANIECVKLKNINQKSFGIFDDEVPDLELDDATKFAQPENVAIIPLKGIFLRFAQVRNCLSE